MHRVVCGQNSSEFSSRAQMVIEIELFSLKIKRHLINHPKPFAAFDKSCLSTALLLGISQSGGKAHRNDGSFILYLTVWQRLCIIFPDNEGGGLGLGSFG